MGDITSELAPGQVVTYQTLRSYGLFYITHIDRAASEVTGIDLTVERETFGSEIKLEGEVLEISQREVPEEAIKELVMRAEKAKTIREAKRIVMGFARGREYSSDIQEPPPADPMAAKESIDPRSRYLFMRVLGHPPPKKRSRTDL